MTTHPEPRQSNTLVFRLLAGGSVAILIFGAISSWQSPREEAPSPDGEASIASPTGSREAQALPPERAPLDSFALDFPVGQETPRYEAFRTEDSPLSDIKLSFKVDPRITRGLHMGDRWVSPPTYMRLGQGMECTIEAKVEGVDAQGKPVKISPQWTPRTGLVTVAPGPGIEVRITVERPGQDLLEVSALGFFKRLPVTAVSQGEVLRVELAQK